MKNGVVVPLLAIVFLLIPVAQVVNTQEKAKRKIPVEIVTCFAYDAKIYFEDSNLFFLINSSKKRMLNIPGTDPCCAQWDLRETTITMDGKTVVFPKDKNHWVSLTDGGQNKLIGVLDLKEAGIELDFPPKDQPLKITSFKRKKKPIDTDYYLALLAGEPYKDCLLRESKGKAKVVKTYKGEYYISLDYEITQRDVIELKNIKGYSNGHLPSTMGLPVRSKENIEPTKYDIKFNLEY